MQCAFPDCPNDALLVHYPRGRSYQRKYCDDHVGLARRANGRNATDDRYEGKNGYVMLRRRANGRTVWVGEHREMMEAMLGRPLRENEQVLHKNKVRNDNRPENLVLRTTIEPGQLICPNCNHVLTV